MKVFLDTNIIFSAMLFPKSIPDLALQKALCDPFETFTSDYCLNELKRVIAKKLPHRLEALEQFLFYFETRVSVVKTSDTPCELELQVRDPNDRPVLRAALQCGAEILITGDKDLLEANITNPIIITASEFYHKY